MNSRNARRELSRILHVSGEQCLTSAAIKRNFVNRTLAFIEKYCDGVVPQGNNKIELDNQIDSLYIAAGRLIESGYFKNAINEIFGNSALHPQL